MSNPKYDLDCWGDAGKPFANITSENNATAQNIALTVYKNILHNEYFLLY